MVLVDVVEVLVLLVDVVVVLGLELLVVLGALVVDVVDFGLHGSSGSAEPSSRVAGDESAHGSVVGSGGAQGSE